jgi:hypothetical protein
MNSTIRTGLLGLVGAVAGFTLQGCFAPQPVPECNLTITAAAQGLVPYYAQLKKVDATGGGTCGNLDHMYVGMQRFRTKASGGDFTVALKASVLADPYLGYAYSADTDPYNNCVAEESCNGEDDPTLGCVTTSADGGLELSDGTPVDSTTGDVGDPNDGGYTIADLTNTCMSVDEPVERRDPSDPDGKNLNVIAAMPQFPTAGRCALTQQSGGTENYEEVMTLTGSLPAVTYKVEFTDTSIINTSEIPGIAFTGKVKITEGSCVANYTMTGWWVGAGLNTGGPEIPCTPTDASAAPGSLTYAPECDPEANPDAGRITGSGMSPALKPLCLVDTDTTRKNNICAPSIDLNNVK